MCKRGETEKSTAGSLTKWLWLSQSEVRDLILSPTYVQGPKHASHLPLPSQGAGLEVEQLGHKAVLTGCCCYKRMISLLCHHGGPHSNSFTYLTQITLPSLHRLLPSLAAHISCLRILGFQLSL